MVKWCGCILFMMDLRSGLPGTRETQSFGSEQCAAARTQRVLATLLCNPLSLAFRSYPYTDLPMEKTFRF